MSERKFDTFDSENRNKFHWEYSYNPLNHVTGVQIERDCEFCAQTEVVELTVQEIVDVVTKRPVQGIVTVESGILIPRVCPTCKSKYNHNIDLQQLAKAQFFIPNSLLSVWVQDIKESRQ